MNVEFLEPAAHEFHEAIAFYNMQRPGLGHEFAEEIEKAIERIKNNPLAWSVLPQSKKDVRRCLTNRFPYGVIYQVKQETLLIVAVWHQRRRPIPWQNRIPNT